MPKAWNEAERQRVDRMLRNEGRKLFERYGVQKTTVDDLVRAAGISKGAFYHFYPSKEELYFRILEELEEYYHEAIYGIIRQPGLPKRNCFREFLCRLIDMMTTVPIYRQLNTVDYTYLLRKLPEERVKAHVKSDFDQLARYFGTWMEHGWMRRIDSQALNGLFMSLFYFLMHREDFGGAGFEAAKELWIDMLVTYLIPDEREE